MTDNGNIVTTIDVPGGRSYTPLDVEFFNYMKQQIKGQSRYIKKHGEYVLGNGKS